MELVILGSGTYEPEIGRKCSGYLVRAGGQNLVFDFGRGVLDQLMRCGVEYRDINAIFITHVHADHCSELASFLHISLHESELRSRRTKEVTIYGSGGIREALGYICKAFILDMKRPRHKVLVRELEDGELVRGEGWTVRGYASKHPVTGLCYRIESGGKALAYSGDTLDCPGLREACREADVAVIEASWPESVIKPKYGHMSGETAGRIAQESGVRKLVLTHAAPYYLDKFDAKGDARKFYKGPLVLAKDLMRVKI